MKWLSKSIYNSLLILVVVLLFSLAFNTVFAQVSYTGNDLFYTFPSGDVIRIQQSLFPNIIYSTKISSTNLVIQESNSVTSINECFTGQERAFSLVTLSRNFNPDNTLCVMFIDDGNLNESFANNDERSGVPDEYRYLLFLTESSNNGFYQFGGFIDNTMVTVPINESFGSFLGTTTPVSIIADVTKGVRDTTSPIVPFYAFAGVPIGFVIVRSIVWFIRRSSL